MAVHPVVVEKFQSGPKIADELINIARPKRDPVMEGTLAAAVLITTLLFKW